MNRKNVTFLYSLLSTSNAGLVHVHCGWHIPAGTYRDSMAHGGSGRAYWINFMPPEFCSPSRESTSQGINHGTGYYYYLD
jgi:hypothetical protein